jgi:hypothetical protein
VCDLLFGCIHLDEENLIKGGTTAIL